MLKNKKSRLLSILIIISLILSLSTGKNFSVPTYGATTHTLQNPKMIANEITTNIGEHQLQKPKINADGTVIWDCIWFGNYYQSDAEEKVKEPIKWRVLDVNGNDAFLIADKLLDSKPYNNYREAVTWKDCDLREWLNTTFIDTAFSYSEKIAMWTTPVHNESGITTYDRIYLISYDELNNPKYGFSNWKDRNAYRTNYAVRGAKDYYREGYESAWWVRCDTDGIDGCIEGDNAYDEGSYEYVNWSQMVRPVVHINLDDTSEYSYAGTVSNIDNTEWDCVWFGNYYQSDVNGKTKEPIKWRVLEVNGDDAFLLADKKLDVQSCAGKTWESSSMRKWLNDKFYNAAFSQNEQAAIKNTLVINKRNPYDRVADVPEQKNTTDKVYLLSLDEVRNPKYGFSDYSTASITRKADSTAYAAQKDGEYWWFLRTFDNASIGCRIESAGAIHIDSGVVMPYAVRPVIHLNLKYNNLYSHAGTVKADGTKNEVAPNIVTTNTSSKKETTKVLKPSKMKIKSLKNVKKRGITVSWKKQKGVSGYEIKYSTSKKFKNKNSKTKIVKKQKTTKKTFYGLKKKKTYYVKLRAYSVSVKGKVYGKWSKVKKVKIKK